MAWVDDIATAMANLGGQGHLDEISREVSAIRSHLPQTWEATIRGEIERFSSDSEKFNGNRDLFHSVNGLGHGIWALRGGVPEAPTANDLSNGTQGPERVEQTTYRIIRDTAIARELKALHQYRCQLCGLSLLLSDGQRYCEAHHIRPLGTPHNGPDIAENILCVCPNHHVQLDYFSIPLKLTELRQHQNHRLSDTFPQYHNACFEEIRRRHRA